MSHRFRTNCNLCRFNVQNLSLRPYSWRRVTRGHPNMCRLTRLLGCGSCFFNHHPSRLLLPCSEMSRSRRQALNAARPPPCRPKSPLNADPASSTTRRLKSGSAPAAAASSPSESPPSQSSDSSCRPVLRPAGIWPPPPPSTHVLPPPKALAAPPAQLATALQPSSCRCKRKLRLP